MHSLAVTEQRASFKAWTLLLAISAFSLCLLGTFLVRSGVLVSVHAFASDPARGMFILAFMVLVIGGSLLLFAARGHKVRSRVNNALWSRESLLLANNVLLVAAMLVVLLGTLLPLVHKQLGTGQHFDWRTVLQHHVYLADGAVCAAAWCRSSGALGARSPT